MKKIKTAFLKIFRRRPNFFYIFKRHHWLLIFTIFIFLVITYILSVLILISPARIKLSEFKKNIEAVGPCHEDCLLARKQLKDELAIYFKQDKKFQKEVANLFLADSGNNATSSLNFKKELLAVMAEANGAGNPPDFIADYFLSADANTELKAEIIKLFLASIANSDLTDYYFSILNSQEALALKVEAVRALSGISDKRAYFKIEEIAKLEVLILQSEEPLSLKVDLIFLLSDFYEFFPAETKLALREIFEYSSQNVVQAFAADTLNNLGFVEFIGPNISAAEWAEYYNN